MKKQWKGALAATAAIAVLLGGSGTLASWNDSATVLSKTVTAGTLSLGPCTVGPGGPTATGWFYRNYDTAPYTAIPDISTFRTFPGQDVYYSCNSKVSATGPRLRADVVAQTGTIGGALAPYLDVYVFLSDSANADITDFTSDYNGQVINVIVLFQFMRSNDNGGQNQSVSIPSFKLVTQQQPIG
ncbi:UNVERIFIED_ORG: alternate signal-mediated exported protein [Nocardia globerula]|uniref:Alternate signal-mediated exported protein n=1 Tax=Nocardia globerula TaxID=1818 RepID=A0A652YVY9_NOCGL|nr:alternate-type signal peptide domain-containing protein [Rhodococcus globerulus]NMD59781.1 alternate-type signal peptide domain-containing protein [Nocardia globerula]PVX64130.1 alternate signal-mediated exported protein [Rhodococcus globerulus]